MRLYKRLRLQAKGEPKLVIGMRFVRTCANKISCASPDFLIANVHGRYE